MKKYFLPVQLLNAGNHDLASKGDLRMKKSFIIVVNVIIMAAILLFVVFYSRIENRASYERQIEHFENITVTMEHVTENYLEGEQRICDVWAQYINSKGMTVDEAADYIRSSHVLTGTSAHLVFTDTLKGLSTRPRLGTNDDYAVSYERVALLNDVSWIDEIGESINITRTFTNPMSGEQSLAFCNRVTLRDSESGSAENAVLLRIIPISELQEKWIFPQMQFENAELAMIDANGNYILKGYSFKNSSFLSSINPIIRRMQRPRRSCSTGSHRRRAPFPCATPTDRSASLALHP